MSQKRKDMQARWPDRKPHHRAKRLSGDERDYAVTPAFDDEPLAEKVLTDIYRAAAEVKGEGV